MIDIHCHILHRIDDGPTDLDESVQMALIAREDGIKTIVATPHVRDRDITSELISQRIAELKKALDRNGVSVDILYGADISSNIALTNPTEYTINNTRYLLLEPPQYFNRSLFMTLIKKIIRKGFVPILTHPERNPTVLSAPETLMDFIRTGALIQITAESLSGGFGPEPKECSTYLLKKGMVHFLATDAHSKRYRRPVMSEGLEIAKTIVGSEAAERLVKDNPQRVISNLAL